MQFSWQALGLILLGIVTPTTRKKIHFRRWGIGKSTYNNVHIIVTEQLILFKIITEQLICLMYFL